MDEKMARLLAHREETEAEGAYWAEITEHFAGLVDEEMERMLSDADNYGADDEGAEDSILDFHRWQFAKDLNWGFIAGAGVPRAR